MIVRPVCCTVLGMIAFCLLHHPLVAQETKKSSNEAEASNEAAKKDRPKLKRPEWFESLRNKYSVKLDKLAEDIAAAQAKVDDLTKLQDDVTAEYVEKLLAIIEKKPSDATALAALLEILNHRLDSLTDEQTSLVFKLLTKHHAASEKVQEIFG